MPELPEVETIRRGLEREVVGKRIKSVEVSGLRSIRRHKTKKDFISRLEGAYRVRLASEGKSLQWSTVASAGQAEVQVEEPETDFWSRMMLEVLSVLIPENWL